LDTRFEGFKPGQEQWIFKGYKSPYYDFLRRGKKAVGPMSKVLLYVKEHITVMKEILSRKIGGHF
jgi:hypothetical protein